MASSQPAGFEMYKATAVERIGKIGTQPRRLRVTASSKSWMARSYSPRLARAPRRARGGSPHRSWRWRGRGRRAQSIRCRGCCGRARERAGQSPELIARSHAAIAAAPEVLAQAVQSSLYETAANEPVSKRPASNAMEELPEPYVPFPAAIGKLQGRSGAPTPIRQYR